MTKDELKEKLTERMLNGETFTFTSLYQFAKSLGPPPQGIDPYRLVDGHMQALRKQGKITFARDGRAAIWSKVA